MGVEEVVTAPRSPWQNPYVERLIGSVRRECLNHVIVLNERHLRRILVSYLDYYHRSRTHLSLGKDTPERRSVQPDGTKKSWRFHRSTGSIIGTSGSRPEHRWVPFESSRVAMKTPPGSLWIRRHFPPRQEHCRWQADKSKRRFRKTPCLLRSEKRIAADGEGSVGGPDVIKRRDSPQSTRPFIQNGLQRSKLFANGMIRFTKHAARISLAWFPFKLFMDKF